MAPSSSIARQRFTALVDEFVREQCRLNPTTATFLGYRDWDHEVPDTSAAGWQQRVERNRHWLQRFTAVDTTALTDAQRIDRELILARTGSDVANSDFEAWRRSPEMYVNDGVFDLFVHRARPEAEAVAAAVDRLAKVPQTVANAKANLSDDFAHPAILTRDLGTVEGAAEFLRGEIGDFVADPALRKQLLEAAAPAAAAYDDLAAHIRAMAKTARGTFVFGEKRYTAVLQIGEQLTLNARTLRDTGWKEYHALDAQMGDVAQRIFGTRDWKAVMASLQKQHATDMPALLEEYREATERARRFVADHRLMSMPSGEHCAVEPAPAFERAATAVASYFPAAPFLPGTHGTFMVPFTPDGAGPADIEDRLQSNAHYEIPATTAHEAYPGHHAHFVRIANANALRQFLQSDYFVEGWALYVEKMMGEQGFYRNDEELLGQLAARLMRAGRIIVDTSLHMGEMTIDEAADFMRDKVGLPAGVARTEALRYAATPTQAAAYLTGAMAIEGFRDLWLASAMGTLRDYHDAITDSGALPVGLAARAIGLGGIPAFGLSV